MKFSLIIPAKDEERRIVLPLLDYYAALYRRFGPKKFEILIVVNNTTDRTVETLKLMKKILRTSEIRIFDIGKQESKGRAVIYGLEKAKGKIVGFTDADGSYNSQQVMRLYRKLVISGKDAIIPNRYSKNSVLTGVLPWNRKLFSRLFNFTIKRIFGLSYQDTQGGLKLFTKQAVQAMLPQIVTFGWTCDVNMLLALNNSHMEITESSIDWSEQPGSNLSLVKSGVEIAKDVFNLAISAYIKRPQVALSLAKN